MLTHCFSKEIKLAFFQAPLCPTFIAFWSYNWNLCCKAVVLVVFFYSVCLCGSRIEINVNAPFHVLHEVM